MNDYYNVISEALDRAGNPARTTERATIYAGLRKQMAETLEHTGMAAKKIKAELKQFDKAVSTVEKQIATGKKAVTGKPATVQPEDTMGLVDWVLALAVIAGVAFGVYFLISLVLPFDESAPTYAYDGTREEFASNDDALLEARAWCKAQEKGSYPEIAFAGEEAALSCFQMLVGVTHTSEWLTAAEKDGREAKKAGEIAGYVDKDMKRVIARLGEFKPDYPCKMDLDAVPGAHKDALYQRDMEAIEGWFEEAEADFDKCLTDNRAQVLADARTFLDNLVEEEVFGLADPDSDMRKYGTAYLESGVQIAAALGWLQGHIGDAETDLYNANVDKWNDFIKYTVEPARERGRDDEREWAKEAAKEQYEQEFMDKYGVNPNDNCQCDGGRTMRCDQAPCIIDKSWGTRDNGFAAVVKNVADNIRVAEHRQRQAAYEEWLRQHPEALYDDDDDDDDDHHRKHRHPRPVERSSSRSYSSYGSSSSSESHEERLFNGEPGYYFALSSCNCDEKASTTTGRDLKLRVFISNVVWYKGNAASIEDQTEFMNGLFFNAMKAQYELDNADFVYGFTSELDAERYRQKQIGDFTSKDYQVHNVYIAE